MTQTPTDDVPQAPVVRIEHGNPDAEEIAAIAVVLAAAAGSAQAAPAAGTRRGWSQRSRTFNPGAVRGSGWGFNG